MLKALHFPFTEPEVIEDENIEQPQSKEEISYTLDMSANSITLNFELEVKGNTVNESFSVDLEKNKGKLLEVSLITTDSLYEVSMYEIFKLLDKDSFMKNNSIKTSDIKIARLVIDDSLNVLLVIPRACKDFAGVENIYVDSTLSMLGNITANSEFAKKRIEDVRKKASMLNMVDLYNSIAYLEAQVDILTRVILEMDIQNQELKTLLTKYDKQSVLDIKPLQNLENEIPNKNAIRNLQGNYYEKKYV